MTVRDELESALALAAKATAGPWSANNRGCYQIGGEDEGSVTSADGWNDIDEVSCVTPLSAQDTIRGDTTYRDAAFIASAANLIRDHGPALLAALDLLDQLECCTGQDCGCQAATKREVAEHLKEAASIVADAERGKWVIDNAAWIRRDGVTVMEITLPEGVNLSSWGCRRDAIDRARSA